MSISPSPFLGPSAVAKPGDLAILHLRRDHLVPILLTDPDSSLAENDQGYAEGAVTNTRFGSFPHKTLLGRAWGSQVLASKVDTGTRGRTKTGSKRKRGQDENGTPSGPDAGNDSERINEVEDENENDETGTSRPPTRGDPITADTGFAHLLPPTPEAWTVSLPHRTQVVYTPDSSYILQRMRVGPGMTILEAGAGSGSFTHAAARAVYNGLQDDPEVSDRLTRTRPGKVYSFEYHETRAQGLRKELVAHKLDRIVRVTHRDVYADGFWISPPCGREQPRPTGDEMDIDTSTSISTSSPSDSKLSPRANAIFLDLPAPWLALPHLARSTTPSGAPSPLDPTRPVHICTFSPCVEQVTATVSAMRNLGFVEIEMVEVQHKRLDVRRDATGASSVADAVKRLRDLEERERAKQALAEAKRTQDVVPNDGNNNDNDNDNGAKSALDIVASDKHDSTNNAGSTTMTTTNIDSKKTGTDDDNNKTNGHDCPGPLLHRTEPDLKGHSSYLVFAILPQTWSDADEEVCATKWGSGPPVTEELTRGMDRAAKKEMRRRIHEGKNKTAGAGGRKGAAAAAAAAVVGREVAGGRVATKDGGRTESCKMML